MLDQWKKKAGPLPLWAWAVAVSLVGLALRLHVVFDYSFFIDDGETLRAISFSYPGMIEQRLTHGHLPLYFILFKAWSSLFGMSLLGLRLPAMLLTLVSIPIAGEMARRLGGLWAAITAMVIVCLHGTMLRHAAEIRMYSMMIVLGPLLMLSLEELLRRQSVNWALLSGALHAFLLSLHLSSIFFAIPLFLAYTVLGIRHRACRSYWLKLFPAFIVPIMILLPQIYILIVSVRPKHYNKFEETNLTDTLLHCFMELVAGVGGGAADWRMLLVGAGTPLLALSLILFPSKKTDRYSEQSERALVYILAGWGAFLLAWAITLAGFSVLGNARYYLTGFVPLMALLAAAPFVAQTRWNARGLLPLICFLVLAAMAAENGFYRSRDILSNNSTRMNYLIRKLKAEAPPQSYIVVADEGATTTLVEYYLGPGTELRILGLEREMSDLQWEDYFDREHPERYDIYVIFYRNVEEAFLERLSRIHPLESEPRHEKEGSSHYFHFPPVGQSG